MDMIRGTPSTIRERVPQNQPLTLTIALYILKRRSSKNLRPYFHIKRSVSFGPAANSMKRRLKRREGSLPKIPRHRETSRLMAPEKARKPVFGKVYYCRCCRSGSDN
ncbi:hypothetical protein GWI33_001189 [Rhynchophorus ferrugineus]|uniref:Uncharacterized protein n=1 Tax=Rhynchophorus ferrugineus TaxID=354439 RepID=A0A834HSG4_RHYFE|nr:hypothetical protein GWI33_001189 [Rhynchophorus ferrugineus]